LHELLCCFSELKAPTTYQCFSPQHFLLTYDVKGCLSSEQILRLKTISIRIYLFN
jgi:hypothetical protein